MRRFGCRLRLERETAGLAVDPMAREAPALDAEVVAVPGADGVHAMVAQRDSQAENAERYDDEHQGPH